MEGDARAQLDRQHWLVVRTVTVSPGTGGIPVFIRHRQRVVDRARDLDPTIGELRFGEAAATVVSACRP